MSNGAEGPAEFVPYLRLHRQRQKHEDFEFVVVAVVEVVGHQKQLLLTKQERTGLLQEELLKGVLSLKEEL